MSSSRLTSAACLILLLPTSVCCGPSHCVTLALQVIKEQIMRIKWTGSHNHGVVILATFCDRYASYHPAPVSKHMEENNTFKQKLINKYINILALYFYMTVFLMFI